MESCAGIACPKAGVAQSIAQLLLLFVGQFAPRSWRSICSIRSHRYCRWNAERPSLDASVSTPRRDCVLDPELGPGSIFRRNRIALCVRLRSWRGRVGSMSGLVSLIVSPPELFFRRSSQTIVIPVTYRAALQRIEDLRKFSCSTSNQFAHNDSICRRLLISVIGRIFFGVVPLMYERVLIGWISRSNLFRLQLNVLPASIKRFLRKPACLLGNFGYSSQTMF